MKTFEITEQQLAELSGRLNSLFVSGLQNAEHLHGIRLLLEQIVKPKPQNESNVVLMPDKDVG